MTGMTTFLEEAPFEFLEHHEGVARSGRPVGVAQRSCRRANQPNTRSAASADGGVSDAEPVNLERTVPLVLLHPSKRFEQPGLAIQLQQLEIQFDWRQSSILELVDRPACRLPTDEPASGSIHRRFVHLRKPDRWAMFGCNRT